MAQIDIGVDEDGEIEDPELAQAVEEADEDYESPMQEDAGEPDAFDLGSILGVPRSSEAKADNGIPSQSSSRRTGGGRSRGRSSERQEQASEEPKEPEAKPHPQFGFEIPPGLRELFTPKGFGHIMSEGISGFYNVCGSKELDDDEKKLTSMVWAFYAQARFPQDWTWAQPEVILIVGNLVHLMKYDRAERAGDRIGKGVNRMIDWFSSSDRFYASWFKKRPPRVAD